MPEFYPSIGDAVGAAMQHNIRLAHGTPAPVADAALEGRYFPPPSADPYSVPGMIARLSETAPPNEVVAIVEEINGALVGALPQLTELVAAAADWTRARLDFGGPHQDHNPTFETWTYLAAAHSMLRDAAEALRIAEDGIADCPAALSDPKHHTVVNVLRTRELLNDVMGAPAPPPEGRDPGGERQRAARTVSPQAAARTAAPSAGAPEAPASPSPWRAPRTR